MQNVIVPEVSHLDPSYERYARLVQAYIGAPVALVSFVDDEGQVFPGALGLPEPWQTSRTTPLSHSFCQHVVASDAPLVVSDAREVPFLKDNLAIPDLGAIAYAGFPVRDVSGRPVGSLCAIDGEPREWTDDELAVLRDLAAACTTEIRLRTESERARTAEARAAERDRQARVLLQFSELFARTESVDSVLDTIRDVTEGVVGARRCAVSVVDGNVLRWVRAEPVPGMPHDMWAPRSLDDRAWPGVHAAALRTPLLYPDAAALNEAYPIMRGIGGSGATAVLPLVTTRGPLGSVVVRWAEPREMSPDLVAHLTGLAGYAAVALERAMLLEGRIDAVATLQGAMLGSVPEVDGVALDAVYAPALATERVGGDWFDVLPHEDGAFDLVVGDVTGHDLHAAARMGQLRTMLRTLAWEHALPPSRVLELLDDAIAGTGLDVTSTIVLARVGAAAPDGTRTVRWSSAGHPCPLVVRADGTASWATPEMPDLLVGFRFDHPRHDHEVQLSEGDTLVLYTDGLVERRGGSLRDDLESLRRTAGSFRSAPRAKDLLDALAPGGTVDDDVVVLAATVTPPRR